MDEQRARESVVCPGCGRAKRVGLVVCWACFKAPRGLQAYPGGLASWLRSLGKAPFAGEVRIFQEHWTCHICGLVDCRLHDADAELDDDESWADLDLDADL